MKVLKLTFETFLFLVINSVSVISYAQSVRNMYSGFITDSAELTAFVDAIIIDGTGTASKNHQTVVIKNGIITQIGKSGDTQRGGCD